MTALKVFKSLTLSLVFFTGFSLSAAKTAIAGILKETTQDRAPHNAAQRTFQDHEIRIILEYFKETNGLPPGLAKKDRLPPGLEKQVRQRGTLPPGLQKRLHPLPGDLEIRLPKLPKGMIRVVIGADVVLMDTFSNVILDVIEDVFG